MRRRRHPRRLPHNQDRGFRDASTDYTEEAGESGQMFSGEVPGGLGTINVVYIFDEDLWVLATGGSDIGPMKTLAWEVHKDRHTPPKGG